jgi:hypothetical protein
MCFEKDEKVKTWKDVEKAVIRTHVVSVIRIGMKHSLKKVFM